MASIILKAGREKTVVQRHPWIFSGAIAQVEGNPGIGETVDVLAYDKKSLGKAAYSPQSQMRARMWTWDTEEQVDLEFLRNKVSQAIRLRSQWIHDDSNAYRLVHAESDGLPGVVVDRYADWLVFQSLTAGSEYFKEQLVDLLVEITGINNVYERSDVEVRRLEGLPEKTGPLRGKNPPGRIEIRENGISFLVDIISGQKTGFYLDQRVNRQELRLAAKGKKVLNCFCYTGGFSVYAIAGGAVEVLSIDSSAESLRMGIENCALNHQTMEKNQWLEGDVFQSLRKLRDQGQKFDVVVLDPPKFAPTAAQVEKAARAYKDINLLGFKLLNPGGLLFTFSCSGGIDANLFQKIVAGAALDAKIDASIIKHLEQAPDHPVALNFSEGAYLKGLVCEKAG